jgi:hypothetical protein
MMTDERKETTLNSEQIQMRWTKNIVFICIHKQELVAWTTRTYTSRHSLNDISSKGLK